MFPKSPLTKYPSAIDSPMIAIENVMAARRP